jgi:nucleoside-diphosphate-sugar epimerase
MTIFITGGTSSIGRVLVQELARQGQPMRLLVRPNSNRSGLELPGVEFVPGDVTDPQAVKAAMRGCDRVTHMAAVVGQNTPETEWWRVNQDGSRNVLQVAYEQGVSSMVQVSTLAVWGYTAPGETADETRQVDVGKYFNLYQKTKHAADEIARDFAARGLSVKIIYPAFGYGCSRASSHPSLQDQTLLRMASGKPVAIMGSGRNRLCLEYYNDTVLGIQLAHERGRSGDGYILGGENLTFPELWVAIAKLLGKETPTRRIPLPLLRLVSQVSRLLTGKSPLPPEFFEMISYNWVFSSAKAQRELGWQPHTFRDGIAETWAAYQKMGMKR